MKAIDGIPRIAMVGFFVTHIFATVMIDGQRSFLAFLYPDALQAALTQYTSTFHDPLMSKALGELLWFQSLICCEIIVQLPFFFLACYYFGQSSLTSYPKWFRYYCIIYGAHTSTTMAPILTTLISTDEISENERYILFAFYTPYLIFPLWLLYIAVTFDEGEVILNNKKRD